MLHDIYGGYTNCLSCKGYIGGYAIYEEPKLFNAIDLQCFVYSPSFFQVTVILPD